MTNYTWRITCDVVICTFQVPFRPEDAYTGYLVERVRKLLGYPVQRQYTSKLSLKYYKCGLFDKWFYHFTSSVSRHVVLHGRIKNNDTIVCDKGR